MVVTKQITKAKFLELYAQRYLEEIVPVSNRLYALTSYEAADEEEGYVVVYCEI